MASAGVSCSCNCTFSAHVYTRIYTLQVYVTHVRYFPSCPLRSVPMHGRDAVLRLAYRAPCLLVAFVCHDFLSFNTEKLIRNPRSYLFPAACNNRCTRIGLAIFIFEWIACAPIENDTDRRGVENGQ